MGNSASVTPKGTELAVPRPDIDIELCPPGTMAAMEALEAKLRLIHDDPRYKAVWQSSQIGRYDGPQYEEELDRVTAILTAHRAKPAVSQESRQATQPTTSAEGKPREFDAGGNLIVPDGYEEIKEHRDRMLMASRRIDGQWRKWESTVTAYGFDYIMHIAPIRPAPEAQP